MRVRPLGQGKRQAKYAVWSIADITRDRERQEDVFKELQHAIEYLDHAPCGFFSVNPAGDVVYVELPKVGAGVKQFGTAGVVESVKAASDVYAPISGEVLEVNDAVIAEPALVNSDAAGRAWFFKLKIADRSELGGLMDEAAYKAHTA